MFRLAFLALVFVSLSSGMAVANEEMVAPATVGIAPTWLPALGAAGKLWLGRAGWTALGAGAGAAAGRGEVVIPLPELDLSDSVGFIVRAFVVPIVSAISIVISLWIIMKGLRLLTSAARRD